MANARRRSARTPAASPGQWRNAIPPSTWAVLAIAAFGAALRLVHIGHDLPDFIEEAIPLRRALSLWGAHLRVDWNPHLFHYPSLGFDLHLALQIVLSWGWRLFGRAASDADYLLSFVVDPTPMVIPARILHVAMDTATIVAAGVLGERLRAGAGVVAALLVAAS